jgi:hypothetical protein
MAHTKIKQMRFLGLRDLYLGSLQSESCGCSAFRSVRESNRWSRRCNDSRARTRFRAVGYQAAADEIIDIRESASEVRSSRRKLMIPVVTVAAGQQPRAPDDALPAMILLGTIS